VTALLECVDLTAGYGRIAVVRNVDVTVESGSVLAILGPNGAGKTTLMMTMAGLLKRLGGSVVLNGRALPNGRPRTANRQGLVLVADDRALFTTLTVQENLEAARRRGSPSATSMLDRFPALEPRWKVKVGALSGGEQQMLAVARGIIQQPRVLLIDEMSMGLAPIIVESLLPMVRDIAQSTGTAVVLVEQHVNLALEVADHAVVLVHGEVALAGTAAALAADMEGLEAAYLGQAAQAESVQIEQKGTPSA
jgi:branched-chain amino acid transport system ATP-binding protein